MYGASKNKNRTSIRQYRYELWVDKGDGMKLVDTLISRQMGHEYEKIKRLKFRNHHLILHYEFAIYKLIKSRA